MTVTGLSALPASDAEKIKRLERIVEQLRNGGDGDEIVEILKALAPMLQNGSNTKTKVAWITGAFAVCGLIGGYLAVEVISQGKAIIALQTEIQRCLKVNP